MNRSPSRRIPVRFRVEDEKGFEKTTFLVEGIRAEDKRERKLKGLLAASKAINSSLVLDEVLERVMDAAIQVTGDRRPLPRPSGAPRERCRR